MDQGEGRPSTRRRRFSPRLFVHLALVAGMSGCAQGPSAFPAPRPYTAPEALASPAAHFYGNDWMYSSQPSGNEVVVYQRKKKGDALKYYETLSSGFNQPMGMVATPDGKLYVANSGDSNVPVYRTTRKGPEGPIATLGDSGEVPVNVDVTPDRRLVAVSNQSTTGGGAGSVTVYRDRQNQPSRVLTYGSDPIEGEGIAIDSNGNCYWSFNDPKTLTGSIVEFAR